MHPGTDIAMVNLRISFTYHLINDVYCSIPLHSRTKMYSWLHSETENDGQNLFPMATLLNKLHFISRFGEQKQICEKIIWKIAMALELT